ncbi:MAG: type 1 glutamine amidotransferase, partial [Thermodesulfobacteriota bacterium]
SQLGHELQCTRLWAGDILPAPESVTGLIVMGGPMSVHDEEQYSWMSQEKGFLHQIIKRGVPSLGICLGAQLLAHVLGAEVKGNPEKEIGWFPVRRCDGIPPSLAPVLPEEENVFHWHGETFTLPEGGVRLYSSEACVNQAFLYKEHVLGLQFHLEMTPETAAALIDNCRAELIRAPWIMSEKEMLSDGERFGEINHCMQQLLQSFFSLEGRVELGK